MTIATLRRLVDAFFRRWPIYLGIFAGSLILGIMTVRQYEDEYTSRGAIFIDNQSLVTTQSGVQDRNFFSYLSPAQFTSQELQGLVRTDVFMFSVLERADIGLSVAPELRNAEMDWWRASITTSVRSRNIVGIDVTTSEPDNSLQLAQAVIDEFVQFQINLDVAESEASEEFFSGLVVDYQQDLADARSDVNAALRGASDVNALPARQQLEIERLREAEVRAEERYRSAVENIEASRLATLQTETDIRQSYSIFDLPQVPAGANGSLFDDLTSIAAFGVVGAMLALFIPVTSALMGRVVIFPDDLEFGHGSAVIAVLPKVSRRSLDVARVITPVAETEDMGPEGLGRSTITFTPPGLAETRSETEVTSLVDSADKSGEELTGGNGVNGADGVSDIALDPTESTSDAAAADMETIDLSDLEGDLTENDSADQALDVLFGFQISDHPPEQGDDDQLAPASPSSDVTNGSDGAATALASDDSGPTSA